VKKDDLASNNEQALPLATRQSQVTKMILRTFSLLESCVNFLNGMVPPKYFRWAFIVFNWGFY
jgi:hypothetical protein